MKPFIVVVLGQTATGKSALAVKIAKKLNGEIISADSRQIYKSLNIGTGKIAKKEMLGVPHHLLDVANPKLKFAVSQYKSLADKKIKEILGRGKTPIICGGTGFYIDAVTKGVVFPEVPPNAKLRKVLEKKSALELFTILKKLDARRAKTIDKNNKTRLVRAIEIVEALGKVPAVTQVKPKYKFIKIGLHVPIIQLQKKVEKRVANMFKEGLLKEIAKLKRSGISDKRLKELGFEYWNPSPERVIIETIKYAKRQMTWFKRDKEIKWLNASNSKDVHSKALKLLN
ncbi:MAG: tRNA (adenosine(37)-N6)-dimethylallyltransferase MiaA [Minisyncoccia bacterium]